MKVLLNMVNHKSKLDWFKCDWTDFADFLEEQRMHGSELIFHDDYDTEKIPKEIAVGMHLKYWPTWLDFWRGDALSLESQFMGMDNAELYYGGSSPDAIIDQYKREFDTAKKLEVDYAVFHVSHVEVEHAFTWDFTYSDEEVLDCAAELVNRAAGEKYLGFDLLFENLWWPGLNFKNPDSTLEFIDKIKYPQKGFMLDIGHLMITNPDLKTLDQACDYIQNMLERNKAVLKMIKGIHLNQSLTGDYLKQSVESKLNVIRSADSYWDVLNLAREHIGNIDTHLPFINPRINEILELIDPKYLVYEFLPKDKSELKNMIKIQNKVLGR